MGEINLNTILNGPVGSGRNYLSILYAISIIDGVSLEELKKLSSKETHKRFNDLTEEGRIFNTSFSENLSYEDFIEKSVGYDPNGQIIIQNGLLKMIALTAKQQLVEAYMNLFPGKKFEVKFSQLYKAFLKEVEDDNISTFISAADKKFIIHKIEDNGNFYVRGENSFSTAYISRAELKKIFDEGPSAMNQLAEPRKKLTDPVSFNPDAYLAVYNAMVKFEQAYVNDLMSRKDQIEKEEAVNFEFSDVVGELSKTAKKYVLIIEHMDVANAFKIFGDTLVLLDENKRDGKAEETFVYLQYSKMAFSLPPNLYLIGLTGTEMNNASSGNLSLLNNFDIILVTPNVKDIWEDEKESIVEGIDLFLLYNTINKRLELLNPDKLFINPYTFKSVKSLTDLRETFQRRIIPQLVRALEGNLSKVRLILGEDFIAERSIDPHTDFLDFTQDLTDIPKKSYFLTDETNWTIKSFKRIYGKPK